MPHNEAPDPHDLIDGMADDDDVEPSRDEILAFGERYRRARLWWLITFPITFAVDGIGLAIGIILLAMVGDIGTVVVVAMFLLAALINWTAWWRVCALRCPRCRKRFAVSMWGSSPFAMCVHCKLHV